MNEPVQLDLIDWLAAQAPTPATVAVRPEPEPGIALADARPIVLVRVDPSCNMNRFYSLSLTTSLFGEVGVLRRWGRIGRPGQSRTDWHEDAKAAEAARQILVARKGRRGYVPMLGA